MRHNSVNALPIARLMTRFMANAMHNTAQFDHERRVGGLGKRQPTACPLQSRGFKAPCSPLNAHKRARITRSHANYERHDHDPVCH